LLGWVVNNGLWHILIATGLFTLPLVVKVMAIWLKVRECGEDAVLYTRRGTGWRYWIPSG
ncbi:hypothetical protein, partial [Xenorhabdus szentirmaii]|uniref:hypothetical protein n=1 Tax=Xenorhabdus szentirmaii TaxID=290112 RepID=UPI002B4186BC